MLSLNGSGIGNGLTFGRAVVLERWRRTTPDYSIPKESVDAEIEKLLHARRIQHWNHRVHERVFGLMRGRRRFAGMIVTRQEQYPTGR